MSEYGIRFCEWKKKEVINTCNCKRLGYIIDLVINPCNGDVEAIVVPGPGKMCGFLGYDAEYVIPFACICKMGPDIILVEIDEAKILKSCQ